MTVNEQVDAKIVERVKKLLNLARDGGATEAEAALAMERAQAIMLDNNLSMAMIETSSGVASEARAKDGLSKNAALRWQRVLMATIAESCFCHLAVTIKRGAIRYGATREIATGYQIIGRVSNVAAAKQMFEYLLSTGVRLRREYMEADLSRTNKDGVLFAEGLGTRLAERIHMRHRQKLREQREEAERKQREEAARSRHPGATGSANALVIILEDYASIERDLNEDLRRGYAPGTTRKTREENEARYRRIQEEESAKKAKLMAEGVPEEVAWFMACLGWTREHAEDHIRKSKEEESNGKNQRRYRSRKTREDRMAEGAYRRSFTEQYQAGVSAGDTVGLDEQVSHRQTKKIGG